MHTFRYAYVGVYLFGRIMWNAGINEHQNFSNFGMAFITLIRCATLDNWFDVMQVMMMARPLDMKEGRGNVDWGVIISSVATLVHLCAPKPEETARIGFSPVSSNPNFALPPRR